MAVLCLVDDLKDCINHMDDLISIARDGVVNKDEVEIWEKAMKDLDELLLAIINIRLVKH